MRPTQVRSTQMRSSQTRSTQTSDARHASLPDDATAAAAPPGTSGSPCIHKEAAGAIEPPPQGPAPAAAPCLPPSLGLAPPAEPFLPPEAPSTAAAAERDNSEGALQTLRSAVMSARPLSSAAGPARCNSWRYIACCSTATERACTQANPHADGRQ
eukprot:364072-Chlamydomonas_euryale.AAC.4